MYELTLCTAQFLAKWLCGELQIHRLNIFNFKRYFDSAYGFLIPHLGHNKRFYSKIFYRKTPLNVPWENSCKIPSKLAHLEAFALTLELLVNKAVLSFDLEIRGQSKSQNSF